MEAPFDGLLVNAASRKSLEIRKRTLSQNQEPLWSENLYDN